MEKHFSFDLFHSLYHIECVDLLNSAAFTYYSYNIYIYIQNCLGILIISVHTSIEL